MCDLFRLIFGLVVDLFRSRAALEAEVLVLRQQIIVLRRGKPTRLALLIVDRVVLGWVCHLVSEGPQRARHRSTRYRGELTPCRLPIVLAMEVPTPSRPSRAAG
jgi:hypothetical protein